MSKINPKNQSEELRRAKLDFVMRNPEERQKLTELLERNKKKRDEVTTALATIGGEFSPEQKERWNFLYQEALVDEELVEYLKKIIPPNAVNSVWRWPDYCLEDGYQRMITTPAVPGISNQLNYEELKDKVIDMHCRDAREIFTELMNERPAVHLLLGIDLTRSKDVIVEEVKKLVDEYKTKLGIDEVAKKRFKWLPNAKEMSAVWDMREEGKTFEEISDIQGIKGDNAKDTAKKRFYRIFPLITGEDYDKNKWKELLREHLGKIAKTQKPTDKKFWDQVSKLETTAQNDFILENKIDENGVEKNLFEVVGEPDAGYEMQTRISDIENLCNACPDEACRAKTMECLSAFKNGDSEAFADWTPDCPKLYNYLKS